MQDFASTLFFKLQSPNLIDMWNDLHTLYISIKSLSYQNDIDFKITLADFVLVEKPLF